MQLISGAAWLVNVRITTTLCGQVPLDPWEPRPYRTLSASLGKLMVNHFFLLCISNFLVGYFAATWRLPIRIWQLTLSFLLPFLVW